MVTLNDGRNSLFRPGGTALIIHADPDDEKTDPSRKLRRPDGLRRH